MTLAKCHDCGTLYGHSDWIDTILSNEQWGMIFPERDGLLCANCIVKRASRLTNVISVKMTILFANDYEISAKAVGK